VKEANAVIHRSTNSVDEEERSYSDLTAVASWGLFILTESQLQEKLQRWLSPPDPSTNHNIARHAHHMGTASWFIQGGIFKQWKLSPSLLWIHGKRTFFLLFTVRYPTDSHICSGFGKKCLVVGFSCYCCLLPLRVFPSSGVIQDILSQCEAGSGITAYFYCDFRNEYKQNCRDLVLSIISQLCAQSNLCCDTLSRIYLAHNKGAQEPSNETLIKCLTEMVSLPVHGPIYLIVDALDECPNNYGLPTAREEVLDLINDLVGLCLPNLHICVTSRPEIDIQTALEPLTTLRVSLHDQSGQKEDIVEYVSSVVYSDKKMRRWREEDRKLVIDTLSERADGMYGVLPPLLNKISYFDRFRWVYCQLEALRHCLPPSVARILEELPETLDETYERVLREINKANREHARRLLQCLTVALQPLRVEELAEVLAIDIDAPAQGGIPQLNPNWRWEDQRQAVLSTCSSLIAIVDDGRSKVVQFSHFSVKKYLTSDRLAHSSADVSRYHIVLEPAHTIIAQACLGVLLRLDDRVNKDNVDDTPLVEYATRHWVDHARFERVSSHIRDAMEYFFDADKPHWTAWCRVQMTDEQWQWFRQDEDLNDASPLYYASLGGFYDLAEHLVDKHPEHVNARGGLMVTPLVAALRGKYFEVAELLYRHGADVDVLSSWECTPLFIACVHGLMDTLHWLLNHGAGVNAQTNKLFTPLHVAADYGHPRVAQILIEHNADIHTRTDVGQSPLHMATSPLVKRYQVEVMQVLLDHGANPNARDNDNATPLHYSSWWKKENTEREGTVAGTRLLLKHGAIIDAEDSEGRTPLRLALEHGRDDIATCLREHGATR
jgi:ankyrin repeat protein